MGKLLRGKMTMGKKHAMRNTCAHEIKWIGKFASLPMHFCKMRRFLASICVDKRHMAI